MSGIEDSYNYIDELNKCFELPLLTSKNYTSTFDSYTVEQDCNMLIHSSGIRVRRDAKSTPNLALTINGVEIAPTVNEPVIQDSAHESLGNHTVYGNSDSKIWILHLNKGDVISATAVNYNGYFVYGYIL